MEADNAMSHHIPKLCVRGRISGPGVRNRPLALGTGVRRQLVDWTGVTRPAIWVPSGVVRSLRAGPEAFSISLFSASGVTPTILDSKDMDMKRYKLLGDE